MTIETRINQWNLIRLKSSCTAKGIIKKKWNDNPQNGGNFANDAIDTGLISKIYVQLDTNTNFSIEKWAEDPFRF